MKAKEPYGRTIAVLTKARETRTRLGLSVESIRDDLNRNYLHKSDGVTVYAVTRWLSGNKPMTNIMSEYMLALLEWVVDNNPTSEQATKPKDTK